MTSLLWTPSPAPARVEAPPPVSILTVLQPVASAMTTPNAGGYGDDGGFVPQKQVENRGWRAGGERGIPRAGLLVAVHAGARWWPGCTTSPAPRGQPSPEMLAWVRERWPTMPDPSEIPRSAVIGCIRVRAAVRVRSVAVPRLPIAVADRSWGEEVVACRWTLGPVAWWVDRAWAFKPIPWTAGGLTLTAAPAEIAAACLAAGARLAEL